ncbi:MAG TPA: type IV pili methyl-accepting chemotaxis transducer N-terminal domain-containing protein, partial [Azospira sp.]|nr:type IV pili methyl-accepting chemotaxis transducer N-terminal domain-containing protein [Azospira sp.]
VQLEKHSGTNAGRLVNVSGRQRMLSQRMAKFYQALAWGVGDANSAAELDKARKEFAAGHKELAAAAANTQQIKDGLELVNQQWFFFEHSLNQRNAADKKQSSTAVATTSERILEEMEVVVGLYEKLPTR